MIPKAPLTLQPRMSGSRWVITPSWLSESLRSVLYGFSVYYCHLFLISSAFVRYTPFVSCIVPIFAWNVPLVSLNFLKRSLIFPILLFSSISLHWSLRKAFLSLLAIFWNSAFRWIYTCPLLLCLWLLFFSQLFVRAPQTTILPFCTSFSWQWFWPLPPVQCQEPPSIVLHALYPILSLESICHFLCMGVPGGSEVKASACNVGDLGSISGSGRSPGDGNGNPLQYSCLVNPMDGGAWWVHGIAKSQTQLSEFTSFHFCIIVRDLI